MECKKILLKTIDSTNAYAKAHLHEFSPDNLTFILANEQTQGKGRLNRSWHSPKDKNIYATFYVRLDKNTPHLTALSHLLALSFCQVLIDLGLSPHIKWPNDIYLNGKKLAGILSEVIFHENSADCILGIGINVNMTNEDLAKMDFAATSLKIEQNSTFDLNKLTEELKNSFIGYLEKFKQAGFHPFHNAFDSLLLYKGERVLIENNEKTLEGIVHSTSVEGFLNLYLNNGQMLRISSGTLRKKQDTI